MKPENAKNIIGHEKRWAALTRAFAKGIVPQTLLISGPAQVGKWTLAVRYAQLLLCPQTQQLTSSTGETLPAPCGHCRVCHQVEIETFPDFVIFRPIVSSSKDERDWVPAPDALEGSIITVDMARKFGNAALSKPLVGARKVMIINQSDRMSNEAQNALLKTFEEPVHALSIILLTDNPSRLLPTVYSRCWHLPLGLVGDTQIAAWLPQTGEDTGSPIQQEWVNEAVRVAAGRPGAAYRELRRLQRRAEDNAPGNQNGKATGKKAAGKATENTSSSPNISRFAQASAIVERIAHSQPVGALGLTEESIRLARQWWTEDQEEAAKEHKDLKKADAKVQRSAVARYLDELSNAYRMRWVANVEQGVLHAASGIENSASNGSNGARNPHRGKTVKGAALADGLDQIRKTRHYILHNANTNLALDVMFSQLIALHQASASPRTQAKTPMQAPVNRPR